ncbi:hypothetical protein [Polaromonas sp. CG9_12]|uniref:DUF883 family protein n=1 Tax=Polaromonas sp. CG_9.11 TaxID=2787730 RepID=UPI0004DDD9BE|nr:hypothetical protein [Polaromonas sp. CG_9.11]MBG6076139.1 ElaB/YqjD/DUF883 family membrane-anchored ribosome-binding protein [Polaromonas sp. CG_9.11]CDS49699.1 hypothetical protein [Polaromonas sp. CG9_12]
MENSTSYPGDQNSGSTDNGALKRGVETAGSALHSSIDKMVDPALDAVGRVTSVAHDAVNRLSSGATHVADRVSENATRVSEASGRAVESSKSWIQDKPLEAVGMALALGFILGRLTAR